MHHNKRRPSIEQHRFEASLRDEVSTTTRARIGKGKEEKEEDRTDLQAENGGAEKGLRGAFQAISSSSSNTVDLGPEIALQFLDRNAQRIQSSQKAAKYKLAKGNIVQGVRCARELFRQTEGE